MEQGTQPGKLEILLFYTTTCASCSAYLPLFDKAMNLYRGHADFKKIDIDKDSSLNNQYNLTAVPTTIAVKDGVVLEKRTGQLLVKEIINMTKL